MLYITTNYDISFFEPFLNTNNVLVHAFIFAINPRWGAPDKDKPYQDKQEFIYIYIYIDVVTNM